MYTEGGWLGQVTGWAGWLAVGAHRADFWIRTGQTDRQMNQQTSRPGGDGSWPNSEKQPHSLYPGRQFLPQSTISTVDRIRKDTYTHSTYPDGTHTSFLVPVPVQVPVQVQDHPGHQGLLPPSLNTDLHLFRPCWLAPSFSTPISPLSIPHTCPLLLDLNDYRPVRLFFFFIAPLPVTEPRFRDDRLLFIFRPLSLFGRALLSSSPSSSSFPSRTTTHHLGLLLRTRPFCVSADPQT